MQLIETELFLESLCLLGYACQRHWTVQSFIGVGRWTIRVFLLPPCTAFEDPLLILLAPSADCLPTALTVVVG
jgi:hypothetical protein